MSVNGERPAKNWASWWARDTIRSKTCTLSAPARSVLLLLAAYANAAHYCNPGIVELAENLGIGRRTVQRARAELEAAGLVRLFTGGQGPKATNGYWLPVTGVMPAHPKGATLAPLARPQGRHPGALNGAELSTRAPHSPTKGATLAPEVDSEVSKERARVSSPPPRTKTGRKLLRDGAPDWDAP